RGAALRLWASLIGSSDPDFFNTIRTKMPLIAEISSQIIQSIHTSQIPTPKTTVISNHITIGLCFRFLRSQSAIAPRTISNWFAPFVTDSTDHTM
ncbi:hypothetical protein AB2B41_23075, partial [Marimonas sp. MJW-29]